MTALTLTGAIRLDPSRSSGASEAPTPEQSEEQALLNGVRIATMDSQGQIQ
ncbi:hypothetical protein [Reyranella sp.]|uniref:hypothetical protein n=1 Tax=Reyranella sp. TaxID=1929291 RepID=UPI003BA930EB